jgi:hypothetical protein
MLETAAKLGRIAKVEQELRKKSLREWHQNDDVLSVSVRRMPTKNGDIDWRRASEMPLFRRKRAETLGDIFFALHHLKAASAEDEWLIKRTKIVKGADRREVLWSDPSLGRAVRIAIREIRKNGVARRVLDVNVCGAAPTYRQVLGGKLAAMSLFSSEVQEKYLEKYAGSPSHIASCMAGRPIKKKSHLCVLTTTSLYGIGSSQYNRVRVNVGPTKLEWTQIGETEGFGSVQFSKPTIEAVRRMSIARARMRNVNYLFGEGTSPLMRQMREGLAKLGFEANDILQHENKRLVYAAELYEGARDDLVTDTDTYSCGPRFSDIAFSWQERWLKMRIASATVLEELSKISAAGVKRDLMPSSKANERQ